MPRQIAPEDHPHRIHLTRAEDKKILLQKFQIWSKAMARYNESVDADDRAASRIAVKAAEEDYKAFATARKRE